MPDTVTRTIPTPIMRRETVRCSLPWAFMAPRTVPTTEQQMPTKAIMTMNQRIETVWETARPQQVFDSPSVVCIRPSSPHPRDLLAKAGRFSLQLCCGGFMVL
jgi:hypothetical protein